MYKIAGFSTVEHPMMFKKPQKCGVFYVKFLKNICCTVLHYLLFCDMLGFKEALKHEIKLRQEI